MSEMDIKSGASWNSEKRGFRASASTWSMKISASMAVPPKFCFHQLVASNPVGDLLIRAKHLFVAAKAGRVQESAANRQGERQRQSVKLEALQ